MSHIAKIELEVRDLGVLKAACSRLGLSFVQGQRQHRWFGRFVGDSPLPVGVSRSELGRCDHAILIPGCDYEIGVVKVAGAYELRWDTWERKLEETVGKGAGLLKQAYAVEKTRIEARKKGYHVLETKQPDGLVRLRVCMG